MADIGLRVQVAAAPDLAVGVDPAEFDIWLREQSVAAPQICCFPTRGGIRPAAAAGGGDVALGGAAVARATAGADLKVGADLAAAAVAGATTGADLNVGIDLAGAATAGATADAGLTVGVDLAADAAAGATGEGALGIGVELEADAVASAQAEATLTGGETPPEEPESPQGGSPIILRPRRPRWKRNQDAVAALIATRLH